MNSSYIFTYTTTLLDNKVYRMTEEREHHSHQYSYISLILLGVDEGLTIRFSLNDQEPSP